MRDQLFPVWNSLRLIFPESNSKQRREYLCHPPASSFISSCSVLFSPLPLSLWQMSPFTPSPLSFRFLSSVPFSFLCRSFANHNSYFSAQFLSAAISVLFPLPFPCFMPSFPFSCICVCAIVTIESSLLRLFRFITTHFIGLPLGCIFWAGELVIGMSCLLTDEEQTAIG